MNRMFALCLGSLLLLGSASPVLAAEPESPEQALTESCIAARALDGCPACKCTLRGAMLRFPGTEAGSKPRLIGGVIDIVGRRTDGTDTDAAHIVLCKDMKLTHFGRLVAGAYESIGLAGALEACPQVDDRDTDGVVLPFEVKSREHTTKTIDNGTLEATVIERTELVHCHRGQGGLGCTVVPIAMVKRIELIKDPNAQPIVGTTEGYSRSWKLDKKSGFISFGKATGKLAKALSRTGAFRVSLDELSGEEDSRRIVIRW